MRTLARWLVVVAWSCVLIGGAVARTPVDLELVLAVDISYSMDDGEQRLQRDGYVQAFRSPQVLSAIASGQYRRIAVSYVEWAGLDARKVIVPWTLINGPASANAFADLLQKKPLDNDRRTSISAALEFARAYFKKSPFKPTRRVIDISGDGPNNIGRPVTVVRDETVRQGIVINGLAIMTRPSTVHSRYDIPNLDRYYAACVIGGVGSFVLPIRSKAEFASAIRRKLVLEISGYQPPVPVIKAQFQLRNRAKADCLIGEKKRRSYEFWSDPP